KGTESPLLAFVHRHPHPHPHPHPRPRPHPHPPPAPSPPMTHGLIITATHVPPSSRLSAFFDRWKLLNASQYLGLTKGSPSPYALPSYDAVTLVARALHSLLYPSAPASNSSSPNKPSQAQQQKLGQQQVGQQQEGQHKKMGQQRRSQQQKAGQQQQQEGWAQAFQQLELPVLPLLSNGTQDMLAPPLTRLQQSAMGSALRKALLKTTLMFSCTALLRCLPCPVPSQPNHSGIGTAKGSSQDQLRRAAGKVRRVEGKEGVCEESGGGECRGRGRGM
ncbi:unnamed protein product, partial [Closterium sp. NIES-54]